MVQMTILLPTCMVGVFPPPLFTPSLQVPDAENGLWVPGIISPYFSDDEIATEPGYAITPGKPE